MQNNVCLNQPNEREIRNKELEELTNYRIVRTVMDDDISELQKEKLENISDLQTNSSSGFPSLPGEIDIEIEKDFNDETVSSEWRDETILNCSKVLESSKLTEITQDKIKSLDVTMESLRELDMLPDDKNHVETIIIETNVVNSEPTSPTHFNLSRREFKDENIVNLVKTSTKFQPSQIKTPIIKKESFRTQLMSKNTNSPLFSTPLNNKATNLNKANTEVLNYDRNDYSSINQSDSYLSNSEAICLDDKKEYHVKRRSLSAGHSYAIEMLPIVKEKENKLEKKMENLENNHSIGFNPKNISLYDHPTDVSKNCSFLKYESMCALHDKNVKEILIKKYYAAAKVQQQIMSQTENALDLIYNKEGNVCDSARLPCCLDAESLLLLSSNLLINNIK